MLSQITAAEDSLKPMVGSSYCFRCHQEIYNEWSDNPERKPCESCHGIGTKHALTPHKNNIIINRTKQGYSHREKGGALKIKKETKLIELFVMTHCPYGTEAEATLFPIIQKWDSLVDFKLYHIAHIRNKAHKKSQGSSLPPSGKCESSSENIQDGTDRFVSLHGLPEVLEGIRQTVIQYRAKEYLIRYIIKRNHNLNDDWRNAAHSAGMNSSLIEEISALADSKVGDSLFFLNISEAEKRFVGGSPTLFINGREWPELIDRYSIEKLFCNTNSPLCKDFPICGSDADCQKKGSEGKCINERKSNAKCTYTSATRFTLTILNDDTCSLCHTGNILREIIRRFPGATFNNIDINSSSGNKWIKKYKPTAYPSFFFENAAEKSSKFSEIRHTFIKTSDQFLLKNNVVKSYHFINRVKINKYLIFAGQQSHPPVVETLRNIVPLLTDSLLGISIYILPLFTPEDTAEAINATRTAIIQKLNSTRKTLKYLLCRGNKLQERYEEHITEHPNEWKECAAASGIDTLSIISAMNSSMFDSVIANIKSQADSLELYSPDPVFIVNNRQKIAGYNPFVHKTLRKLYF
jgi:hypothetical protein